MASYQTGNDVDAYCGKCKLVLAHVIIALATTRIARVECKTCRSVHAYRKQAQKKATSQAGTGRTSRSSRPAAAAGADYDQLLRGTDISRAQAYRMSLTFSPGDVLDHKPFGLGIVTRTLGDAKIEVVFPSGVTKVLVHDRKASA